GAMGEDVRLGSLEERSMLCSALSDYHRKVLDSSVASGARLLANVQQLKPPREPEKPAEPPPEPPRQPQDPSATMRMVDDASVDELSISMADFEMVSEHRMLAWEKYI